MRAAFGAALLGFFVASAWPRPAAADPPADPRLALGVAASWQQRADFGEMDRAAFAPELVAQTYVAWTGRLHLRPAVRFGFVGLEQPEMPAAVSIAEYDVTARMQLGLIYDGAVIPALTVGAGTTARWIRLRADEPLNADSSRISRTELLADVEIRAGVGLPIAGGRVIVEPFVGRALVFGDDRVSWLFGADATVTVW